MKIIKNKILSILSVLATIIVAGTSSTYAGGALTQAAAAAGVATGLFGFVDFNTFITNGVAWLVTSIFLPLASWFLAIVGMIFNIGMYLTLHLDIFFNNTTVITEVWKVVRDLTSIVLIFFILWAAIQMIIGTKVPNYGELIKHIIVIGILINFSFFGARILIDASNIVSLQFYNAIAPNSAKVVAEGSLTDVITSIRQNGGIADAYMNAFNVTSWYDSNKVKDILKGDAMDSLNIILITVLGSIVMVLAGLTFLAAAVACIIRFVMLIFLLAFSPIWVASMALPVQEFSNKWWKHFKSQLIFLPTFLGLTYVALRITTIPAISNFASTLGSGSSSVQLTSFLNLIVGFTIIFFILNLPLFTALSFAGASGSITESWTKAVRNKMGTYVSAPFKSFGSMAGRNTVGVASSRFNKWAGNQQFKSPITKHAAALVGIGNTITAKDVRAGTTGKMESQKFFGGRSYKDITDLNKEIKKKDKELDRRAEVTNILSTFRPGIAPTISSISNLHNALGKLSQKERLGLGKDLKKMEIMRSLSREDFEAIKKSDEIDESDKNELFAERKKALTNAITSGDKDIIKDITKSFTGKDLLETFDSDPGILANNNFVAHLTVGQLKNLDENTNKQVLKDAIKTTVNALGPTGSSVHGWVNHNW